MINYVPLRWFPVQVIWNWDTKKQIYVPEKNYLYVSLFQNNPLDYFEWTDTGNKGLRIYKLRRKTHEFIEEWNASYLYVRIARKWRYLNQEKTEEEYWRWIKARPRKYSENWETEIRCIQGLKDYAVEKT